MASTSVAALPDASRPHPERSMSRRQPQLYTESNPPPGEYEEEQVISGTGEGDEIMEDAHGEEEEGYSELCVLCP